MLGKLPERVKRLVILLRKKLSDLKVGQRVRHDYYLASFRSTQLRARVKYFFVNHSFGILSSVYFFVLLVVAYFLPQKVQNLSTLDTKTFIISAAAMLGGMLAIIFSIQMLLMQSAAERSSSGFFKTLSDDTKQNVIFWLIAFFVLVLFIIAFSEQYLAGKAFEKAVRVSAPILFIGTTLWLLFQSYRQALKRIDPISMATIPAKKVHKNLHQIQKFANKLAKVIQNDPSANARPTLDLASAAAFQLLKPSLDELHQRLDFFFDYHDKLVSHQDNAAARSILDIVQNMVMDYFAMRKDSSILVPTEVLLANTSDSQGLLTRVFEGLVAKGSTYLQAGDDLGVTHVIQIFKNLISYSSVIKFRARVGENPIFNQGRFYLDSLVQRAIEHKSMEGVFQGALAYADLGKLAVVKELSDQVPSIVEMLHKIVIAGLQQKQNVVWDRGIIGYLKILKMMVQNKYSNIEIQLRMWRESFQKAVFFIYGMSTIGVVESDFINLTNLTKPFDTITQLVFYIAGKFEKEADERERGNWKGIFFDLIEEYRSMLRYLSENMKSADHFIINNISDSIATISTLMLEKTKEDMWADENEELLKQTGWYIHQLSWFFHYAEKVDTDRSFYSLIEATAKIGIEAIQTSNDNIAKEAVKILTRFAIEIYDKKGDKESGFAGPRIMERVCYIGILALKYKKKALLTEAGIQIYEFEEQYEKKFLAKIKLPPGVDPGTVYGVPKKDELYLEVFRWRDDFSDHQLNRHTGLMDRTEDMMYELIEEADIDRFMFEIWGSFPADSPIDKEIEEEYKKKAEARKLIGLLKYRRDRQSKIASTT